MRKAQVLLVEDNEADCDLVVESFQGVRDMVDLHVVRDGLESLEFLRRDGAHPGAPRPDLVLLDLNLPKVDGRDVLATVKGDDALRSIPVVVLSGSDAESDVDSCYDLGANCYVTKPVGFTSHRDLVQAIERFWLGVVQLPGDAGAER